MIGAQPGRSPVPRTESARNRGPTRAESRPTDGKRPPSGPTPVRIPHHASKWPGIGAQAEQYPASGPETARDQGHTRAVARIRAGKCPGSGPYPGSSPHQSRTLYAKGPKHHASREQSPWQSPHRHIRAATNWVHPVAHTNTFCTQIRAPAPNTCPSTTPRQGTAAGHRGNSAPCSEERDSTSDAIREHHPEKLRRGCRRPDRAQDQGRAVSHTTAGDCTIRAPQDQGRAVSHTTAGNCTGSGPQARGGQDPAPRPETGRDRGRTRAVSRIRAGNCTRGTPWRPEQRPWQSPHCRIRARHQQGARQLGTCGRPHQHFLHPIRAPAPKTAPRTPFGHGNPGRMD